MVLVMLKFGPLGELSLHTRRPLDSNLLFSSFGKRFLSILLEFCRSRCCPGYECEGELPELVWTMYQDISYTLLVFSPRNKNKHGHRHPHYQDAYDLLDRNRSVHQFCLKCVDPKCIVNATMLKLVCILLYYFDKVILLFCTLVSFCFLITHVFW